MADQACPAPPPGVLRPTITTDLPSRTPPADLDAERAVLGAIVLGETPNAWARVAVTLTAPDFYTEGHRIIYEAMTRLVARGEPVDHITLRGELEQANELTLVGGPATVALLMEQASISAHLDAYVRIVHEAGAKRETIQRATQLITKAYNGTPLDELATQAETLRRDLAGRLGAVAPLAPTLHAVLADTLADLHAPAASMVPVPWPGLAALLAGGLRAAEYVILGARPGKGKTALALLLAVHAARHNVPALLISREMASLAIGRRIYAQQGQVPATALRRGDLSDGEWATLERVLRVMADVPLWIDARPRTARQVATCIRRHVERCGVRLVVLDYLQLIRVPGVRDPRERVEEVSSMLKGCAQDLGVVVLAISSLARLQRDGRGRELPPSLSDLRESGQLEHDADWVWLLAPSHDRPGHLDLVLAKGRDGATGTVPLLWMASILQMEEAATREPGEEAPF